MSCCACCCFYPKYKRKVDSIYPRNYDSNLIKNEVDKLQYYSCQHPEKLSKIGEYLYQNLKWGLHSSYKYKNYTLNTIEAFDKILLVISPDYLNFYANNYLKMIQKLLEQNDLEYQKLATNSFKKFCEKDRSQTVGASTNYNKNFDQFVCEFSAMCYNNNADMNTRSSIRISGLQGIGAVVKKIVPDDSLQATYLWDNMDKIVSALLFIMHESHIDVKVKRQQVVKESDTCVELDRIDLDVEMKTIKHTSNHEETDELTITEPGNEAEELLKQLSNKVDYTTITRIIRPLLVYMDNNDAWTHETFIKCVFQTVMLHIKQQHAIVIKEIMKHLDSHLNTNAKIKTCIVKAISICLHISAMHSVGTTSQLIDIFTNLLKHLNFSLEKVFIQMSDTKTEVNVKLQKEEEINFQNEILNVMKNFTTQLPDYSKNDVIMFLTRQINTQQFTYNNLNQQDKNNLKQKLNEYIRNKYLDALYEICSNYKPVQVFGAFASVPFLEDILRLTITYDLDSRKKSQKILHFLLDKYNYLEKIENFYKNPSNSLILLDIFDLNLKPSKEDVHFMRKYGRLFLSHINESLFIKSNVEYNYEAIFITLNLFLIGSYEKEFLIDFINFGLHIQYLALINLKDVSDEQKYFIHSLLTAYFDLLSRLSTMSSLCEYVEQVNNARKDYNLFPSYVYGQRVENRITNEFKTEFDKISQNFINTIKQQYQLKQQNQSNQSINELKHLSTTLQLTLPQVKILFDKKTLLNICENSGCKITNQSINNEYSLAVTYLNQITLEQTTLKYRSITNICTVDVASKQNGETCSLNDSATQSKLYSNDGSNVMSSGTKNKIKLLNDDNESFNTSYDSLSNLSDLNNDDLINNKIKFTIGTDGQVTNNQQNQSLIQNLLKQANVQYNMNDDIIPFDTIKRCLLSPFVVSNTINGSSVGSSSNSNAGIVATSIPNNMIQTDYLLEQNYDNEQNFDKLDIVNEFKKKTFDEIKYDINRQSQYNKEKFNKVLEFIQTELSPQTKKDSVGSSSSTINNNSSSVTPVTHRKHHHSFSLRDRDQVNGTTLRDSTNSKLVSLNDIQFPELFMY